MRDNWTEEQITIVLYEYCRRPFGQFNGTKQFVIDLGKLINRTPGAIVRKIGNLASFDPQMKARGVGGLAHTAKLDEKIWNKYYGHWDQLAFDAEMLIANWQNKELEDSLTIDLTNLPVGRERIVEVTITSPIKSSLSPNLFERADTTSSVVIGFSLKSSRILSLITRIFSLFISAR